MRLFGSKNVYIPMFIASIYLDLVLTMAGVYNYGIEIEGNPLIRSAVGEMNLLPVFAVAVAMFSAFFLAMKYWDGMNRWHKAMMWLILAGHSYFTWFSWAVFLF